MRVSMLALAAAFVLAASAAYADDPMANTYGNTVMTKSDKTGLIGDLYFDAGGAYTAKGTGKDGNSVQYPGAWTLKDGGKTICLTPKLPPNTPDAPPTTCSPLEKHNVGDTWKVTNDHGEIFTVMLMSGR
jgi:hypothetical protein